MVTFQRHAVLLGLVLFAAACGKSEDKDNEVSLTSCEEQFDACGGDPVGSWSLERICVDGSLTDAVGAYFSEYPSCENSVREAGLTTAAGVTYTTNDFDRTGSATLTAKLEISEDCFREQAGGGTLTSLTCAAYGQMMEGQSGMKGSCSYDGSLCVCEATVTQSLNASGTYSVDGSEIVEQDGRTLEFCATAERLGYRSVVIVAGNGKVQVTGVAVMKKNG